MMCHLDNMAEVNMCCRTCGRCLVSIQTKARPEGSLFISLRKKEEGINTLRRVDSNSSHAIKGKALWCFKQLIWDSDLSTRTSYVALLPAFSLPVLNNGFHLLGGGGSFQKLRLGG